MEYKQEYVFLAVTTLIVIIIIFFSKEKDEDKSNIFELLKELLRIYHFDNKIRLGNNYDGGYVLCDVDEPYDCYISAGVSDEESFSRDFIIKYNMNKSNCFAFDGTIQDYPYVYTKNITFFKKNISDFNDHGHTDLSFLLNKYNNIFLKMDIEGGEYKWIKSVSEEMLQNIKQIVIEFHGICDDAYEFRFQDKLKCFEKLNRTHYILHIHANNYGPVLFSSVPSVIELTYVNKRYFKNEPEFNKHFLPINNLDFPNNIYSEDIDLSYFILG